MVWADPLRRQGRQHPLQARPQGGGVPGGQGLDRQQGGRHGLIWACCFLGLTGWHGWSMV